MSALSADAPAGGGSETSPPATPPPGSAGHPERRLPGFALWAGGLFLLSVVIVLWARTRPGFDPYGWLVWGHQTLSWNLDTNAAPSWKPLPYLFTVPFGLLGHFQMHLWMFTAVAVSLGGAVFAGRIAWRMVRPLRPEAPAPAALAASFAALGVLGLDGYSHYVLSAQSDPMIVALCLGAIDLELGGRPRAALVLGTLAGLGRPEVWPFLGLYGIWLWRRDASLRPWLVGCALATVLLWFGIPALTSRTPFVAASNAQGSGRALHGNKVFGTIGRFLGLEEPGVELAALAGVIVALLRRDRITLYLAGGVIGWVIIEIAFALHGWPGLARYMFEAAAVMVVIGAVAIGRLLAEGPSLPGPGGWLAPVLALAAAASLVPALVSQASTESHDLKAQRARTTLINRLDAQVSRLGGASRLQGCGEPLTRLEDQTMLAWTLHLNVSKVGFKYGPAIAHGNPIILFTPGHRAWRIQALHQRGGACRDFSTTR